MAPFFLNRSTLVRGNLPDPGRRAVGDETDTAIMGIGSWIFVGFSILIPLCLFAICIWRRQRSKNKKGTLKKTLSTESMLPLRVSDLEIGHIDVCEDPEDLDARTRIARLKEAGVVPQIMYEKLTIAEMIGEGSFKRVYRGFWEEGQQVNRKIVEVAISVLKFDVEAHEDDQLKQRVRDAQTLEFVHEARVSVKLGKHPNIIDFYGVCYDVDISKDLPAATMDPKPEPSIGMSLQDELSLGLSFVTELCIGSLYDIIYIHKCSFSTVHKKRIAFDVANALKYVHAHRMIHRDLKSHNVLLTRTFRAKLCDFGTVKLRKFSYLTTKHKGAGTPGYMAPEQYFHKQGMHTTTKVTEKSDIWAFGCIVMELFAGAPPWSTKKNPANQVTAKKWLPPEADFLFETPMQDSEAVAVCRDCFNVNPEERPTADQIVSQLERMKWDAEPEHSRDPVIFNELLINEASISSAQWSNTGRSESASFSANYETPSNMNFTQTNNSNFLKTAVSETVASRSTRLAQ